MKSKIKFLILIYLTSLLILGNFSLTQAAELEKLANAKLIDHLAMDGDSFHVNVAEKILNLRLYFIDCPEITAASKTDARRVREQTRYFGLPHAVHTIHFGNVSKDFVANILNRPFTVYTSYASALGRSSKGRVYAFIITSEGDDLACLLVKKGLARTYGVGRKTPDGIPKHEMIQRLLDLETSAMLKRIGIWSDSDPDRIAELRAEQRREDEELKTLQRQIKKDDLAIKVVDPNKAGKKELESIPGIGPKIADRIIAGRPYKTVNDLVKVKGIGIKKLEKIRPYMKIKKN